jgi:hypothetical protein
MEDSSIITNAVVNILKKDPSYSLETWHGVVDVLIGDN